MQCNCKTCSVTFYAEAHEIRRGGGKYCSQECYHESKHKSPERLWDRLRVNGDCWEWTGSRTSKGYGQICHNGSKVGTHRLAFELHHGRKLEPGEHVLHDCDNPPCCNPAHLFAGTPVENTHDMIRKGRQRPTGAPGVLNSNAKLDEDRVRDIRRRYGAGGITLRELGHEHDMTEAGICAIVRRKNWRHVT